MPSRCVGGNSRGQTVNTAITSRPHETAWIAAAVALGAAGGLVVLKAGASVVPTLLAIVAAVVLALAILRDTRVGLYAMLVALPLDLLGRIITEPIVITAYHITLVLTMVSWALARYLDRAGAPRLELTIVHVGVLALLGAAVWSLPFSLDSTATTIATARLLFIAAFFFVFSVYLRDERTADRVLMVLAITGAASAAVALVQFAFPELNTGNAHVLGTGMAVINRPAGFFHDPNYLAAFLSLAVIAAVARASHCGRFTQALPWLAAALVSAAGLAVTLSRTGLVGVAVGLLACVLMAPRRRRKALLLALAVGAVLVVSISPGLLVERATSIADVSGDASLATRYYMAGSTVEIMKDHWVFGTGLQAYAQAYPAYRTLGSMPNILQPHELPLALPAEMGVLGLIAEAIIIAGVVAEVAGRRHLGWNAWESAGIAGLAAILVQSLFQYYLFFEYLWLFLALTVAATRFASTVEEV